MKKTALLAILGGVLVAAAPALAADVTNLLGTPAVSQDELGTHRAKSDDIAVDQNGNPVPGGFIAGINGQNNNASPNQGGVSSQGGLGAAQAGSFRGVAVGIQGNTVSAQSSIIH